MNLTTLLVQRGVGYLVVVLAGAGFAVSDATTGLLVQAGVAAVALVGEALMEFYSKWGKRWLTAKLEVYTATAEAQAEALSRARVPAPTAGEIADRIPDPKVTASTVAKTLSS